MTEMIRVDNETFQLINQLEGIQVVDSFVKINKMKGTRGHGEARLYVGPQANDYNEFFNNFKDKAFFLRQDIKEYLDNASVEYKEQEQKYRTDISQYLPDHYEVLKQFNNERVFFNIESANGDDDRFRYYIRSYDDVFQEYFRSIALPIITNLSIMKLMDTSGKYYFYFHPFLEYSYDPVHHPEVVKKEEEEIQENDSISATQKEHLVTARQGQGRYRGKVLELIPECVITKVNDERVLIASHIKPWVVSSDSERIDPFNGLTLTPTYDRLFDQGFISFDGDGKLLVSPYISPLNQRKLDLIRGKEYTVVIENDKRKGYLQYHRETIFKK